MITMDLEDFIPEEYDLPLKINGHTYRFQWGEAQVDEVLMMLLNPKDQDPVKNQRTTVVSFLQAHLVEGDKEEFVKDMAFVPHQSKRGGLSIMELMEIVNGRVKKNVPGENKTSQTTAPSGSPETSRS